MFKKTKHKSEIFQQTPDKSVKSYNFSHGVLKDSLTFFIVIKWRDNRKQKNGRGIFKIFFKKVRSPVRRS